MQYHSLNVELADNPADEPVRSFYGVIDRGQGSAANFTTIVKTDLVEQTITQSSLSGREVRSVSNEIVDLGTDDGWFFDFGLTDTSGDSLEGERVIFEPIAISDRILISTIIPADRDNVDPCVPNVTGFLMEVGAFDGGSPDSVVFDANNDGDFDDTDTVTLSNGETAQVAGIQPSTGAPLPPALIRAEPGAASGESSTIEGVGIDSAGNQFNLTHESPISRTSWRRLN